MGAKRTRRVQPLLPSVPFEFCPIRASLGILGRKWALLVLRDVAFFRGATFSQVLRNNPGLTPRILSMRLRDLQRDRLIARAPSGDRSGYRLTPKGEDIFPILAAFIQFGARYHAARVFEDGRPRDLDDLYPAQQETLLGRLKSYAEGTEAGGK